MFEYLPLILSFTKVIFKYLKKYINITHMTTIGCLRLIKIYDKLFKLKKLKKKILWYLFQCLQTDIEAHARIINSVLKLSTKLKHQSFIACNKFTETGLYLQNKWHCVWLMSLEWQCRLEQELSRKKKVSFSNLLLTNNLYFSLYLLIQSDRASLLNWKKGSLSLIRPKY